MATKQKSSSIGMQVDELTDGGQFISGTTSARLFKWLGSDITMTGSGSNTYTFPSATCTLAALTIANIFTAAQTLAAGTTTLAPLTMQSGTNLTTPAAGATEFDGKVFYDTAVASSRQVRDTEQFITLTSTYTLTSQTAAQKLFNSTTNGALTVPASTSYYFECMFFISSMSGTSGTFGFALGGTATLTSQTWTTTAIKTSTPAAPGATVTVTYNTAANTGFSAGNTGTFGFAMIKGVFRTNAAGTLIPQVSMSQAAAAIVGTDSYFRCWPIGSNTVTNVGNWS